MAKQTVPNTGLWSSIAGIFNSMFSELYNDRKFGVYNYDDGKATTINIAAPDTFYSITNTDSGGQSLKYPVNGIAEIYDTTTQAFDFTSLTNGDTVDIRLDLELVSSGANQTFDVFLFLADDTATPIPVPYIVEQNFKSAGVHQVIRYNGSFMGSDLVRLNEARFKVKSSGTGSVNVNGWYVKVDPARKEVP